MAAVFGRCILRPTDRPFKQRFPVLLFARRKSITSFTSLATGRTASIECCIKASKRDGPHRTAHDRASQKATDSKVLFVTCANARCLHSKPFTFTALGLDDDVEFPSIARCRHFVCTQCGARAVNVMPDWRAHDRLRDFPGGLVAITCVFLRHLRRQEFQHSIPFRAIHSNVCQAP